MTSTAGGSHGGMLTSWKEIAQFFDRDTRTVQRWEKQEGLPVHRHPHQRQSSVYAYTEELQAWWHDRGQMLRSPSSASTATASGDARSVQPVRSPAVRARMMALFLTAAALVATPMYLFNRSDDVAGAAELRVVAAFEGSWPEGDLIPGPIADFNGDGNDDFVFFATVGREILMVFGGREVGGSLASVADVVVRGQDNGDYFAQTAQDLDADGLPDLVVSVLLEEPDALTRTGQTYVLRGRRQWPPVLTLPEASDVTFSAALSQDIRLHACTTSHAVDVNRDGVDDLVLGASEYSPGERASAGGVFVFFGRPHWPSAVDVERDADITIAGDRSGEGLSAACDTGDFNGDGRPDLALLAREGTLWNLLGSRGRYYLFLGRDRWPARLEATEADFRVEGLRPNASLGGPLMADVNGDGLDDLIVPSMHTFVEPEEGAELAAFFGRRSIGTAVEPMSAADLLVQHPPAAAKLGSGLVAADLDSDGIDDLLVSEPGTGRLFLVHGRAAWPARSRFEDLAPVQLFQGDTSAGFERLAFGRSTPSGSASVPVVAVAAPETSRAWLVRPNLPVEIDVRPGYENNILYLPGLLVVRVNGRQMSADPIVPETVRVAGVAPRDFIWRDFDGDKVADLQLNFETADMRVSAETTAVRLTARTRQGRLLAGSDTVVVLPGGSHRP